MQQHGGNPASVLWRMQVELARAGRTIDLKSTGSSPPLAPDPAGFRHFFPDATPNDRITLDGKQFDPSDQNAWKRAEALMAKLAQLCMVAPAAPTSRENPALQSGYTYLLQVVAHDIVHISVLLSRANEIGRAH